jgi:hypothetical protein
MSRVCARYCRTSSSERRVESRYFDGDGNGPMRALAIAPQDPFPDGMRNLLQGGEKEGGFHWGRTAPYYILDRRA